MHKPANRVWHIFVQIQRPMLRSSPLDFMEDIYSFRIALTHYAPVHFARPASNAVMLLFCLGNYIGKAQKIFKITVQLIV